MATKIQEVIHKLVVVPELPGIIIWKTRIYTSFKNFPVFLFESVLQSIICSLVARVLNATAWMPSYQIIQQVILDQKKDPVLLSTKTAISIFKNMLAV